MIALILLCLLVCTLVVLYRQQQKIKDLTEAIDTFLLEGKRLPISTKDNALGHLQTNIYELQDRVIQQQEVTSQEARSNTEFISDISHQLKTPLAGLRLYCEMDSGAHTEKELALISKMETLIQNVLTLEKIRSDTYRMKFELCPLDGLINSICRDLQPLFPQKHLKVTGCASHRVDAGWFQEALGNVIKNACEHTKPEGSVQIVLEKAEKSVSIAVEDDGGGVPPEELPKLFRRFHRTSNAVPTSAGVGLAITKAVVEKHHGMITAENTDKGLRIIICLPVIDANEKI